MSRPEKARPATVWWIVYAGLSVTLVDAGSHAQAKNEVMEKLGVKAKPWLARDWTIRIATDEEKQRYAAQVDGLRNSQKTASQVRQVRKTAKERLFP